MRTEWPFWQNLVLAKSISSDSRIPTHQGIHNDSMNVIFGGIKNTETWSKSTEHFDIWVYSYIKIN